MRPAITTTCHSGCCTFAGSSSEQTTPTSRLSTADTFELPQREAACAGSISVSIPSTAKYQLRCHKKLYIVNVIYKTVWKFQYTRVFPCLGTFFFFKSYLQQIQNNDGPPRSKHTSGPFSWHESHSQSCWCPEWTEKPDIENRNIYLLSSVVRFGPVGALLAAFFQTLYKKRRIGSTCIANISLSQRSLVHIPGRNLCGIHSCTRRWAYCPGLHRPPCQRWLEVEGSSETQRSLIAAQLKGSLLAFHKAQRANLFVHY